MTRCQSTYPGSVTLRGRAVRCELAAGHDGLHGHSFAARYWDDSRVCAVCGELESAEPAFVGLHCFGPVDHAWRAR
jgi:hypothetical protein